ncbi:hypothetical protein TCAL_16565 [Tigriopus californicus]|uniref:BZIP domain-containing protein n=1 Tax=Tigriopus californicus TaxID=6832 RepID=A0A553NDZ4_TIGCA|nr:uncharacterized protein LOC131888724 [Tigriopus californicus]TRY63673.1 hypothetical protein TCAL_16565 [Tigriopus californicus]
MSDGSTANSSFLSKSSGVEVPNEESEPIKLPPSLTLTPVSNTTAPQTTNTTTSSSSFMVSPPIFRRSSSSGSSTSRLLSHPPLPSPSMLLHENNTPTPVIVDKLLSVLPDTPFHLNPFDEAFKHSTRILTSTQVSHEPHEDALHTPKLNLIPESPKLVPVNPVTTLPLITKRDPIPPASRKIRPIAPLKTDLISEVSSAKEPSSAQLLLKFPTGESIHLSDMPVVLSTSTSSGPSISDTRKPVRQMLKKSIARKRGIEMTDPDNVEVPKIKSQISEDEEKRRQILERNRAAAQRSRNKKRHEVAKTRESMDKYKLTIREVMAQNERLMVECQWLKSLLEKHLDCSVTKALNQRELLEKEIRPKIVALPADPENKGQPIEIPLNLIQASKQSKAVVLVKSQGQKAISDAAMKTNE